MTRKFKTALGAMGLALATAATPAMAADFDINFYGDSALNGSTTFRDFSDLSSDGQRIDVRASAWTINGSKIYNSYLGSYYYGLGVTSDNESGSNYTHVMDNQYEKDFVLLQFSAPVLLTEFTTTAFALGRSADSDATIGYGTTANAWNKTIDLNGVSASALNTVLTQQVAVAGSSGSGTLTRSVSGNTASNLWLVAASLTNADGKVDGFKLGSVKVTSPVPEPATWTMMILGFGIAGVAMRRRKAAGTTDAVAA